MNSVLPLSMTLAYVAIAVVLGVRARAGQRMDSLEQWGVAGRSMGPLVMYLLMGAGSISAYTFMGAPGWAWSKGVPVFYVVIYLSYLALIAWYCGPRVWAFGARLGHVTQAQAVAERFESPLLGALTALVMSIGALAYAILQTIGAAYILDVMSAGRLPFDLDVWLVLGAIASYLFISGQRAIGVTNAFQGGLMLVVAWAIGLWATHDLTGQWWFGGVFERVQASHPDFLTLPGGLGDMSFAFWTSSIIVSMFSFQQPVWLQWMSADSARSIRRSATWLPTYYLVILPMVVVGFIGIFTLPNLARPDTVALQLAFQQMPPVLVGLLGAGTLAAAMSSCEPYIHGTALTWTRDVIRPLLGLSEQRTAQLARYLIFPIMLLIVGPLAMREPGNLIMILLVGLGFAAQMLPAFIGIFLWPRATRSGVLCGLAAGFLVTTLFTVVWPNPLGIHAGAWGLMIDLPLFVAVSLLTRPASRATLARFLPIVAPGRLPAGREAGHGARANPLAELDG
ncbi:sodium:solute symporter family protein [Modicisalibacter coralii]|uniref:sodium:solute symporter family protein n=1 Tax=Modicisalibacter coralii TaxID=2304602 RepID=UPI00100AF630|nr:sodium:solute symporter family protein [Halomonas coralii]